MESKEKKSRKPLVIVLAIVAIAILVVLFAAKCPIPIPVPADEPAPEMPTVEIKAQEKLEKVEPLKLDPKIELQAITDPAVGN